MSSVVRLCVSACLVVVIAAASGCGGGGGHRAASVANGGDHGVADAAVADVTEMDAHRQCTQALTRRIVRTIYGGQTRCFTEQINASRSPRFGAHVTAERVDHGRALVRVALKSGDGDDIVGTVTLRFERAGWRIDDFDADYLRSELGSVVVDRTELVDQAVSADVSNCIDRAFAHLPAARLKHFAYGVIAGRHPAVLAAFRKLRTCRGGAGTSVLRDVFESEVREFLQEGKASKSQRIGCILATLRTLVSDGRVGQLLAKGDIEDSRQLFSLIIEAGRECTARRRPSTTAT